MVKKIKILVSIFMLTMVCLSISASAEELNIPSFRNLVAGVNTSNNVVAITTNMDVYQSVGWQSIGDKWYYFKDEIKVTGWLNDHDTWYYLDSEGVMLHDTTVDGYRLGTSGAWIKM